MTEKLECLPSQRRAAGRGRLVGMGQWSCLLVGAATSTVVMVGIADADFVDR